jgi:hypothetical protein
MRTKFYEQYFALILLAVLTCACQKGDEANLIRKFENKEEGSTVQTAKMIFLNARADTAGVSFRAFLAAFEGFQKIKHKQHLKDNILTVIDFDKASTAKRMAIFDLEKQKTILQTYVAHGRNSGDNFARNFSNINGSLQSSLGFYAVTSPYVGKYGKSLLLEGLEKGINDLARAREIVMHPADYASESFIRNSGRLGRSFGCPAFPEKDRDLIVKTLQGGTCLFIWHEKYQKMQKSKLCQKI